VEKKRVIVDYKNITEDILTLLTEKYPYGYDDDVVFFKNAKGEKVGAVPLETQDTKYLIKVGARLDEVVEAFLDDDSDDDVSDDGVVGDVEPDDSEMEDD
jgi:hypothetical protein